MQSLSEYLWNIAKQQVLSSKESRTYISNPSEAPAGANVQRGKRGGYYYDTTFSGNQMSEPKQDKKKNGTISIEESSKISESVMQSMREKLSLVRDEISGGDIDKMHHVVNRMQQQYSQALQDGSMSPENAESFKNLLNHAFDAVKYQTDVSYSRTLGDHGIRHISGNIKYTNLFMDQLKEEGLNGTPYERLLSTVVHFYHDLGYTHPENIRGFDLADHPKRSVEMMEEQGVFDMISDTFGEESIEKAKRYILNHDSSIIDWKNLPVQSSISLADNLGIFFQEKLPRIFEEIPGSITDLEEIQKAANQNPPNKEKISLIKQKLREKIANSLLSNKVKQELILAADETNISTPKFTLGMWSGEIENIDMVDGSKVMDVVIKQSDYEHRLQRLFDMNQKGFRKLADSYGFKNLNQSYFEFKDVNGKTVLRARVKK